MQNKLKYLYFLLLSTCYLQARSQTNIPYPDQHIQTMGRIGQHEGSAEVYWSGTSFTINFAGKGLTATLKDQRGDNYFYVIIDGGKVSKLKPHAKITKIHLDTAQKEYVLAEKLSPGKHTAQLFKCTEWTNGKTWFYGFTLAKGAKILPPPPLGKHKIEFYGNSITCGYAVEDFSGKDSYLSPYVNNYLSYASITARHFNAQYNCIARSGIGIMVSWFHQIMPEMYDLLDPENAGSKWNFKNYTPDVVVVNLFQNDSWILNLSYNAEYKARFGTTAPTEAHIIDAYQSFIKSIRQQYPNANIVCALGSMDATRPGSKWPGYIEKAAEGLNDKKVFTHFFPYKNTQGHPNIKEQEAMADNLISYIHTTFKW
jgi:hypothetical protein